MKTKRTESQDAHGHVERLPWGAPRPLPRWLCPLGIRPALTLATVAVIGHVALDASPARADDRLEVRPPSWYLTVGGGGTGNSVFEREFMSTTIEDHGLLGLVLDVSRVYDHVAFNADLEAYPLGGVYGGRLSMLVGAHWGMSYNGSTEADVTSVWGLDLGASGFLMDGKAIGNLEAGLGQFGQHRLVFDLVYDAVDDVPGIRFGGLLAEGVDFSYCIRTDVRFMFDTDKSPVPFMVSVTVGGGPGFAHGRLR